MPSLLSMLAQRDPGNGLMGRLMQQQAQPQAPAAPVAPRPAPQPRQLPPEAQRLLNPTQGGGGAISRLMGGDSGYLTDAANTRARKQGLMQAGLAMMASDQVGLARLAQGLSFGQQAAGQERDAAFERAKNIYDVASKEAEALAKQAETERLATNRQSILGQIDFSDPTQRMAAMSQLIQSQDFEGAENLAGYISKLPEVKTIDTGNEIIVFDPSTMTERGSFELPEPPPDIVMQDLGDRVAAINRQTGDEVYSYSKWASTGGLSPDQLRGRMQDDFDNAARLRSEYDSNIDDAKFIANAVRAGMVEPPRPDADPIAMAAYDLTLLSSVLRAADPGATVKNDDIERGKAFGGRMEQYNQFVRDFSANGTLSPEKRTALRTELQRLGQAAQLEVQQQQERYFGIAENFRIPRAYWETSVAPDPFADILNQTTPRPAPAGPPEGGYDVDGFGASLGGG